VGLLVALLLIGGPAGAVEADRPEILNVAIPGRLVAGRAGAARITYRARRANVVAVIQVVEDLDGARRVTSQREIGVVAAALGREEGDLVLASCVRDAGPEAGGVHPRDRRARGKRSGARRSRRRPVISGGGRRG
jgi:hypothetical protein